MLPYLNLLGRQIPTYGLMAGIGLILAVVYYQLAQSRDRRAGGDVELAFVFALIGTFLGAKLLSILTQIPQILADLPMLREDPGAFFRTYLFSGFVFYGGLYGGILGAVLYVRAARVPFARFARPLLPTIPLIHAFGRIGCFLTGCCYGAPTQSGFGVVFSHSEIAPNGVPLLPVQLVEAGLEFALFALLAVQCRRGRDCVRLLGLYLAVYGAARFALEFWRGDAYRGFLGPLSVSQWLSIVTVVLGATLLFKETLNKSRLSP